MTAGGVLFMGQPASTIDEVAPLLARLLRRRGWTAERVLRYMVMWVEFTS